MSLAHAPRPAALTVARVNAIEIVLHWRWLPVVVLGSILLGHSVLPIRYPTWETSTIWLTSIAAVLAGEAALLLHELSHAFLARHRGHAVQRIVFRGFVAETQMSHTTPEVLIALAGPAANLGLAATAALVRAAVQPEAPFDLLLTSVVVGNIAAAFVSLLPIGNSDGRRALHALRDNRERTS